MQTLDLEYFEGTDGLLYPKIAVSKKPPFGKYGMMKARFMREHQSTMLSGLRFCGKLEEFLASLNKEAMEMEDRMVEQMLAKDPGPSQSEDWMGWTNHRAGLRKAAEEIIWTTVVMPRSISTQAEVDAIHWEWPESDEEEETEETTEQ